MSFLFLKKIKMPILVGNLIFMHNLVLKNLCKYTRMVSMFCCEIEIKLSSSALRNGDGVNPLYASVG